MRTDYLLMIIVNVGFFIANTYLGLTRHSAFNLISAGVSLVALAALYMAMKGRSHESI